MNFNLLLVVLIGLMIVMFLFYYIHSNNKFKKSLKINQAYISRQYRLLGVCSNCYGAIEKDFIFCENCGKKLLD